MIVAGNRYGELPVGSQIGDTVIKVNNVEVNSPTEVLTLLRGGEGKAIFSIRRGETESDINVIFPFEDDFLSEPYALVDGALIAAARYNQLRYNEGMFQIHSVERRSYGLRAGLFSHAYIVAINGRKPKTVEGICKTLSSSEEAKFML